MINTSEVNPATTENTKICTCENAHLINNQEKACALLPTHFTIFQAKISVRNASAISVVFKSRTNTKSSLRWIKEKDTKEHKGSTMMKAF